MTNCVIASDCLRFFPAKEKICAVAVTYFPDPGFAEHVVQTLRQVGRMVIVDNTPDPAVPSWIENAVARDNRVNIIRNHANAGVARALNQGIQRAGEEGCSWVLLLDQDTEPFDDMVGTLIRAYTEYPEQDRLAMIGCSPLATAETQPAQSNGNKWWTEAKVIITSGTLLSLQAAEKIGPFREEFFIDCVDFEFCLRAGLSGYRIIEVQQPLMQHVIGAPQRVPFQWVARETSNHRPWRSYYITRNLVIVSREYLWKEPAWVIAAIYRRMKEMILLVLFESSRREKAKYTILGFWDGITRRFDRNIP